MFTVEIRINGTLISHIYGRNVGSEGMLHNYECEYYETETRGVQKINVSHCRQDGLNVLVKKILEKVET